MRLAAATRTRARQPITAIGTNRQAPTEPRFTPSASAPVHNRPYTHWLAEASWAAASGRHRHKKSIDGLNAVLSLGPYLGLHAGTSRQSYLPEEQTYGIE